MKGCVGILGGMGPLATVDLMRKIIEETPAARDDEHVPVIAWNVPQVPDRVAAFLGGSDAPLPAMREGILALAAAGAERIAIACNTAHHWHAALAAASPVPVLHIARVAAGALVAERAFGPVGVLGTTATLAMRLYETELEARSTTVIATPRSLLEGPVAEAIREVKAGRVAAARPCAEAAVRALLAAGAGRVILGCTELPVAMAGSPLEAATLDPTRALARACVAWSRAERAAG